MLISPGVLRRVWRVRPCGVLHIGAHDAEEDGDYRGAGWGDVTWVEAIPEKAWALTERFAGDSTRRVIQALAWDTSGVPKAFNIANNGMSSSVFPFGSHELHHPGIRFETSLPLETARLDAVLGHTPEWDFVNIDVQGAELHALRGLGERIAQANWIYTEVNTEPVYDGCVLIEELDEWLAGVGLARVDTAMTPFGWGDALYARAGFVPPMQGARRLMRRSLGRLGLR